MLVVGSFFGSSLQAQEYMNMLESRSYKQFARHLDNYVQIEMRRDKEIYSKEEAIKRIANRLNQLDPVRWELVHKGESEEKAGSYLVLKAYNKEDDGLRIFLHMKEVEGMKKVSSIKFRKLL